MKTKIILQTVSAVLLASVVHAQTPEAFRYQAVARDGGGQLVVNTAVGVQFQLHQGSAGGTVVYAETHSPTTNAQGLFTVAVGEGTPTAGTFSAIDWSAGPYFVEVGLDPAGGTAYTTIGVQQLLSVPYALYATKAGPQGNAPGEIRYWNGIDWVSLPPPTSVNLSLTYCGGGSLRWGPCPVQERLNNGDTPCQIANSGVPLDSLWGKSYLGGLIAYLDPNTCQGFVAAPSDLWSNTVEWVTDPSCEATFIGGTSTGLFTGATNTTTVAAHPTCGPYTTASAVLSAAPSGWYWPSRDEVLQFYSNLHLNSLGGFTSSYYLTSSEAGASFAWQVNFNSGSSPTDVKYGNGASGRIRTVKFF
ncbi:MAG: hypothetical protein IPM12_12975 [Flavobacteriales bacterium]|nr:hypothetical protein [Flavobacteriales bacterium]